MHWVINKIAIYCCFLQVQFLLQQYQTAQHTFLEPTPKCCADCLRVRQRVASSCQAFAAWHEAFRTGTHQQLQAAEQGDPDPPMPAPPFELQLPEGVPEEMPPSVDRC